MDVKQDGTGIESTGWFRTAAGDHGNANAGEDVQEQKDNKESHSGTEESMVIMSRLCALQWIAVLYEYVVPHSLKSEYAREFISPILHQLVHNPPDIIIFKSFEVLAKITVPVEGEVVSEIKETVTNISGRNHVNIVEKVVNTNIDVLDDSRRKLRSRDRSVFAVLIRLYSRHHRLLTDLSKVIQFMCTLQPPEFVFVSFAVELDAFVVERCGKWDKAPGSQSSVLEQISSKKSPMAKDLEFVASFVQQMNMVLLIAKETEELRNVLHDCIRTQRIDRRCAEVERKQQLFHILLHSFAHNLVSAVSLCLWGGAYLTVSLSLHQINSLDINLLFFLEVDQLIELLERPLFRHIHLRMLETDHESNDEGRGAMLFRALKSLLMLLPQSTSYSILRDRLLTVSKFRQTTMGPGARRKVSIKGTLTEAFVSRLKEVRAMHYNAMWGTVRSESLEEGIGVSGEVPTTETGANDEEDEAEKKGDDIQEEEPTGSTILRHPDEVLPKDQITNFQGLTRRGLIQQAQTKASSSDFTPSKRVVRMASHGTTDGVDEDVNSTKKWKEFWLQNDMDK